MWAKLAAYLEQLRLQVEPLVERKLLEQVGESRKVQQGGRDLRTSRDKAVQAAVPRLNALQLAFSNINEWSEIYF